MDSQINQSSEAGAYTNTSAIGLLNSSIEKNRMSETYTDKRKQRASSGEENKQRYYYIDWLRSSDVHVVVLTHCIYTSDKVTGHSLHNHIWKEKMDFMFRFLV